MNQNILVLPVLLPLLTAVINFLIRKNTRLVVINSIFCSVILLIVAIFILHTIVSNGPQAIAIGNWPAPFGIILVADLFSALMVLICTIINTVIVVYASSDLKHKKSFSFYYIFMSVLIAGINGAFLTGDIFNLYVWFEVMLIASFGLMILDATKEQVNGAVKYVILNLISTVTFLLAIGLLYGATGTLNIADLNAKVALIPNNEANIIALLFLFSFSIKSALFPLFAWLPASYHTLPNAIVALFAALLTKVGVYALIRIFTMVFPLTMTDWQEIFIWVAGLTMLIGVLGAASQFSIKRILSFHIISQIGYMIMGLALFTPLALTAAIFYILHHIIVKANLFLIGGFLERKYHSDKLSRLGSAYRNLPWLAGFFLIAAFSLSGFPPLSGFWGKFLVIKASIQSEYYILAGTALFVGLLTVFSMTKIWNAAFWKKKPESDLPDESLTKVDRLCYYIPILSLVVITLIIGLAVEPVYRIAEQASAQLFEPHSYIEKVMEQTQ